MAAYNIIGNNQLERATSFSTQDSVIIVTNQGTFQVPGKYFVLKNDNVSFYNAFASASALYVYENKQGRALIPSLSASIFASTRTSIRSLSATVDAELDKIYYRSGSLRVVKGDTGSNTITINGAWGLTLNVYDVSLNLGSFFYPSVFGPLASNIVIPGLSSIPPTLINLVGYNFRDYRNSTQRTVSASNVFGNESYTGPTGVVSTVVRSRLTTGPGLSVIATPTVSTPGWTSTSYLSSISSVNLALSAGKYFLTRIFNNNKVDTIVITGIGTPFTVTTSSLLSGGPRAYALAYNFTGSTTTFNTIVTGVGSDGAWLQGNINIGKEINAALSASNITIYPGTTAHIFFAPLSARFNTEGVFTFVPAYADPTTGNDFQLSGYMMTIPQYTLQAQLNTTATSAVNVSYNIRKPYNAAF